MRVKVTTLCMLVVVFLLLGAVPAFASAVQPSATQSSGGITVNPLPAAPGDPDLTYHGGPVMINPTNYLIFWLPSGYHFDTVTSDAKYESLIQTFFKDIGNTPYYQILQQYTEQYCILSFCFTLPPGTSSTLGGTTVVTTGFGGKGTAANPLNSTDLQKLITTTYTAKGWSANNGNNEFFVFTPLNVISCFSSGKVGCITGSAENKDACAWHYYYMVNGKPVIYSDMPDVTINANCRTSVITGAGNGPNGDYQADSEISILSHELFESVSDPQLNAWYFTNTSGEIGDLCNFNFGQAATWPGSGQGPKVEPDGSDLLLNPGPRATGDPFLVQFEYSNSNHACVLDLSGPPVKVVYTLTPSAGSNPTSGFFMLYREAGSFLYATRPIAILNHMGTGTYTVYADQGSDTLLFPKVVLIPPDEGWCFNLVSSQAVTPNCPIVTRGTGATGFTQTLFYYDILPQTPSAAIIGGGSPPLPDLSYTTAPTTSGPTDSPLATSILLKTSPQTIWTLRGSMATVPALLAGSNADERWITPVTSWTITGGGVIPDPIPYQHQYFVNFDVSPPGTGTVAPPSGWFNAGADITITATPEGGFMFGSWTSSSPYITFASSTDAATDALINTWGTITANFRLIIVTSEFPVAEALASLLVMLAAFAVAVKSLSRPPRVTAAVRSDQLRDSSE